MFRPIRKAKRALPEDVCRSILHQCDYGVLALQGDDGYPYAVPVNYVFDGGSLWIHSAMEGHKIDAVRRSDKASFCVVEAHDLAPEILSTDYRSVLVFGRVHLVDDEAQKVAALRALVRALAPGHEDKGEEEIATLLKITAILELRVEHISGKEGGRLAKKRRGEASD